MSYGYIWKSIKPIGHLATIAGSCSLILSLYSTLTVSGSRALMNIMNQLHSHAICLLVNR